VLITRTYLISLDGLCNWISFSERVPGTTGFSLANIITPPSHTHPTRFFLASLILLLRICARTLVLRIPYSKKHIALTARKNHDIFFPRNYQTSRHGKGKVNRLFMYFFSHCDAPALISFGFFFFNNIKCITSRTNDNNNARRDEQGCVWGCSNSRS